MAGAAARIARELEELGSSACWESAGVAAAPVSASNVRHLSAKLRGPEGTPYEGGVFVLDITLPPDYPFEPPAAKFVTQVWHPNISSVTGAICLDILKSKSWTPALNVKTMLLSIGALLAAPEPDDPQDAVVASQYIMKHAEWRATARYWTDAYAKPPPATPVGDSKVEELVAMGFSRGAASAALKATHGNVDRAVNFILSSS